MTSRLTTSPNLSDAGETRRNVQLWMVALVSALIAGLFFILAMIDLNRLEEMLLEHRTKKAQYIVEGLERTAEDKFDQLMSVGERESHPLSMATYEKAFSSQEALARALINLATHLDLSEGDPNLRLPKVAKEEDLSAVAILDENGEVVAQTGALPSSLLNQTRSLWRGREDISIHLSTSADDKEPFGYVGIHRGGSKGTVLLVLDVDSLRQWRRKVAVRKAVEEQRWVRGTDYLILVDAGGRTLVEAGAAPSAGTHLAALNVEWAASLATHARVLDSKHMEIALPFRLHDQIIGTARVGLQTPADQFVTSNRRHVFIWTAFMILTGLFAMGLLYRAQIRHVTRLQAMRERLHQAEKLSSLARLAAGVAHEIRNPLNAVSMATQRLQREFSPAGGRSKEEFDRISFIVRDEIKRLNGIIQDFLSLSRTDRLSLRPQPIVDLLKTIVFLAREESSPLSIRIDEQWSEFDPLVLMDAPKMEQALLNIVRNAMESLSSGGIISVCVEQCGKGRASIKVSDTGVGMPEGDVSKIFDPYYTTKENGTGLGLCIAHQIITAHGGEILVRSKTGEGTTFEVLLPIAEDGSNVRELLA